MPYKDPEAQRNYQKNRNNYTDGRVMKVIRRLGETLETDLGFVDLVAIRKALKGEPVRLRNHESRWIYEQYGLTEHAIRDRRCAVRRANGELGDARKTHLYHTARPTDD